MLEANVMDVKLHSQTALSLIRDYLKLFTSLPVADSLSSCGRQSTSSTFEVSGDLGINQVLFA
jgi:hypothetical protein